MEEEVGIVRASKHREEGVVGTAYTGRRMVWSGLLEWRLTGTGWCQCRFTVDGGERGAALDWFFCRRRYRSGGLEVVDNREEGGMFLRSGLVLRRRRGEPVGSGSVLGEWREWRREGRGFRVLFYSLFFSYISFLIFSPTLFFSFWNLKLEKEIRFRTLWLRGSWKYLLRALWLWRSRILVAEIWGFIWGNRWGFWLSKPGSGWWRDQISILFVERIL